MTLGSPNDAGQARDEEQVGSPSRPNLVVDTLAQDRVVEVEAEVVQDFAGIVQREPETVIIAQTENLNAELTQPELARRYYTRTKSRAWSWKDAARHRNLDGVNEGESSSRRGRAARERQDFC